MLSGTLKFLGPIPSHNFAPHGTNAASAVSTQQELQLSDRRIPVKLSLFVLCLALVAIAFGSLHSAASVPDSSQDQIVKLEQDWLGGGGGGKNGALRQLVSRGF